MAVLRARLACVSWHAPLQRLDGSLQEQGSGSTSLRSPAATRDKQTCKGRNASPLVSRVSALRVTILAAQLESLKPIMGKTVFVSETKPFKEALRANVSANQR